MTPLQRGFDSFFGFYGGGGDHFLHTRGFMFHPQVARRHHDEGGTNRQQRKRIKKKPFYGYDFRNGTEEEFAVYGQYTTEVLTQRAVEIINNHDKRWGYGK